MLATSQPLWNLSHKTPPVEEKLTRFHMLKLVVIGIGRFIGGITQFWNQGLVMGKYPYLGSTIWYGVACICLAFSLAELVSALPFTGGLYGYVRGLMGPYYGFICSVFEVYCNIAAISLYLMGFGKACVTALDLPDPYQLLFFIIPFLVCGSLHFSGKKIFWRGSMIITMVAILMVFIYVGCSIHNIRWGTYHANFDAQQPSAISKAQKVVNWQGGPSLFFAGEYLVPALVVNEERHTISASPITIMWTTFSILIIAVTVVYLSTLQPPGVMELQEAALPLNYAFATAFNISYNHAAWLNIPISLSSFVIAMYYLIAILKAMASSGLLPGRLLRTMGNAETPYEAIRVTYLGAVGITLIYIASSVAGPFYSLSLYTLSTFYLYSLWIGLMIAYLLFRRRYSGLKRDFRSPLGVYGAYIAIFSAVQHFLTQFYPIHAYSIAPFIIFLLSMVALTYVYVKWIIKYQKYSEEEERVFFVTYIVSANRRSQERRSRRRANKNLPAPANNHGFSSNFSTNSNSFVYNYTKVRTNNNKVNGPNDEDRFDFVRFFFTTGDNSLYTLVREVLNPSNITHREVPSPEDEEEEDEELGDKDEDEEEDDLLYHSNNDNGKTPPTKSGNVVKKQKKKTNASITKKNGNGQAKTGKNNNTLTRVLPTVQVDCSLDLQIDGTDSHPNNRSWRDEQDTASPATAMSNTSTNSMDSFFQHNNTVNASGDTVEIEMFSLPTNNSSSSNNNNNHNNNKSKKNLSERLVLSDIPEEEI